MVPALLSFFDSPAASSASELAHRILPIITIFFLPSLTPREESEDRQLLADNALAEAAGREAEVAADAACSRVLEALLPHAATQQLAAFTRGCVEGEGLGELCTQ